MHFRIGYLMIVMALSGCSGSGASPYTSRDDDSADETDDSTNTDDAGAADGDDSSDDDVDYGDADYGDDDYSSDAGAGSSADSGTSMTDPDDTDEETSDDDDGDDDGPSWTFPGVVVGPGAIGPIISGSSSCTYKFTIVSVRPHLGGLTEGSKTDDLEVCASVCTEVTEYDPDGEGFLPAFSICSSGHDFELCVDLGEISVDETTAIDEMIAEIEIDSNGLDAVVDAEAFEDEWGTPTEYDGSSQTWNLSCDGDLEDTIRVERNDNNYMDIVIRAEQE